jgi:hypothetical protein
MQWLYLIGGVAIVTAFLPVYHATLTGNPTLDRLRLAVTLAVIRAWGALAKPEYARALMVILRNESGANPANYVGDLTATTGPSIGPWQVSRGTALALGLWAPEPGVTGPEERAAFASLAQNEYRTAIWAAFVLKDKLRLSGGDLREAIRRYNGSGPKAEEYADKAWAYYTLLEAPDSSRTS